eukprot:SAG22_NODE_90_length_21067_cov_8.490843_5_plen_1250_part_00
MSGAPGHRSNPYLAQQQQQPGADAIQDAGGSRVGPQPPPVDGAMPDAVPEDGIFESADVPQAGSQGVRKTRPSFVRRSFTRRSGADLGGEGGTSFASSAGAGEYDPPSAMEIIEYAKYLGMNPIYDADLLWIAAEGLTAPLPAGWTEHEDAEGNLYFYNTQADHSTREHPLDKHYRQTYLNEKRKKEIAQNSEAMDEDAPKEKKGGLMGGLFGKKSGEAQEKPPADANLPAADGPLASAPGFGSVPTTAEGSEPTLVLVPADIRDMAVYLGIHIRTEADMLWVARESLTAPLPPRWEELEDEAGHPYYYNLVTGTTTRKHPLDHYFVQLVKFERWNPERKRHPGGAWMDFVDSQGRVYYYNFENDQTTYERPANVMDDDAIKWFSVGKKAQLESYLATRIEAVARGRQARKRLAALKNLDTLRDLLAAKKIQYAWRTKVASRHVARWHNSVARGMAWGIWRHRARASPGFQMKVRRSKAAQTIQRYWRGHVTRSYVGHVRNKLGEMKAVLKIQAAYRGFATRKRIKKTRAAIKTRKIQDDARMRRLKDERIERYQEQLAIKQKTLWQKQSWKKWCVALEPRVEFQAKVKRIRAAVKIQQAMRMYFIKRRAAIHSERIRRIQWVIRLQCKWRGIHARRRYKYDKAATDIQAVWRGRKIRVRFVHELACLRVQCVWRGYVVRKNFGRFLAARVMQAAWRGFWGRKQFELQYSARNIQSLWRGYVARRAFRAHYAAGTLQKCWRGYAIRKRGLLLYEIQQRTAVKIQAHYRGYLTRRELTRAMQEEAVIRIQRAWRRVVERRKARAAKKALQERQRRENMAATRIQAAHRAQAARAYAAEERRKVRAARDNLAAREIQRVARGKASRERLRREREAALAVEQELATINIQRVQRGRQGRKVYLGKRRTQAATKIQSAARRKEARKVVAAIKAQKQREHDSAVRIQCFWRRKQSERALERRRAAHRLEKRRSAALRIQTNWRGRIARKWLHRERKRWKKADRSLYPEIYDSWFDHADRFHYGHEDMEARWPYEQSEEWRGNIHAAYLAGKELRNKRYALLQQHFESEAAGGGGGAGESRGKTGSSKRRSTASRGHNNSRPSGTQQSVSSSLQTGGQHKPPSAEEVGKSRQTQRVYGSVQGILRTLVQRGIFEETGLPVDTVGLRKISKPQKANGSGGPGNTSHDYQLRIATTRGSQGTNSSLPYQMDATMVDPTLPAAAGGGVRGIQAARAANNSRKQAWDADGNSLNPAVIT